MQRDLHDHFFRQAKRDGYLSRAAYKLIEIDDRKRILRHGQRVLDLGCAPGSWLQVVSKRVGPRGIVVGVDLKPPAHSFPANVRTLVGDVLEIDPAELIAAAGGTKLFDVVICDMAPATTGNHDTDHHRSVRLCEQVLGMCPVLLAPGGHLVMKVFEGGTYPDLIQEARRRFEKVKGFKPKASRSISREMYVIGLGHLGANLREPEVCLDAPEVEIELPKGRPSTGWQH